MSKKPNSVILPIINGGTAANPASVARQILSVQPMTGPAASIFTLKPRYAMANYDPAPDAWEDDFEPPFITEIDVGKKDWYMEVMLWAAEYLNDPYGYKLYRRTNFSGPHTYQWQWGFMTERDCALFKLRWCNG